MWNRCLCLLFVSGESVQFYCVESDKCMLAVLLGSPPLSSFFSVLDLFSLLLSLYVRASV